MLHRTTWLAIPIVTLAVFGTATSWWGYNQYQARQAMASQLATSYSATFHSFAHDIDELQENLGSAVISNDPAAMQGRLRNIWRLSDSARANFGRLPSDFVSAQSVPTFLAQVNSQTQDWLTSGKTKDAQMTRTLQEFYAKARMIYAQVARIQGSVIGNEAVWTLDSRNLPASSQRVGVLTQFHKMDLELGANHKDTNKSASRFGSDAFAAQPVISPRAALERVSRMVRMSRQPMTVELQNGPSSAEYLVHGSYPNGTLIAHVTRHGGHVLDFHFTGNLKGQSVNFVGARTVATTWLQRNGFEKVILTSAAQLDDMAYFVYNPDYAGVPAEGQGIFVKVSLGAAAITAFDANDYYFHPIISVPGFRLSEKDLATKLNPAFHTRLVKKLILRNKSGGYESAVVFYGTYARETYRVAFDARDGRELFSQRLSRE